MGELSLGRPKGDRGRLIGVQFPNLFYNYFGIDFDYCPLNRGWPLNIFNLFLDDLETDSNAKGSMDG